jgi:hypothetical protein
MGILDKLMFWKRDEELNFDHLADQEMNNNFSDPLTQQQNDGLGLNEKPLFDDPSQNTGFPPSSPDSLSQPSAFQQTSPFQGQAPAPPTMSGGNRDLELMNSKLDTIKALLNSLDQRVANLEKSLGTGKKETKLW